MHLEPNSATDWLRAAAAAARTASSVLGRMPEDARNAALRAGATALREHAESIVAANAEDIAAFDAAGGTAAFRDRLKLTPARVAAMAQGLEDVANLPDPLARTLADWTRPNGLRIRRVAAPIGVIGMIYESRPNVGADAAGLCLKSGNALLLRGGSDSFNSARALAAGKSLLPAGVRALDGSFRRGDAVVVQALDGRTLGRGLSAYGSVDAARIIGHRSEDIEKLLGWRGRDELIHRDDLVLL